MKKLLLTLPLLALPLTAMAQENPTQAPQEIINDVAKTLMNAVCKERGIKEVASEVYTCYQNTKVTDPYIENCMISDLVTIGELKRLNDKAEAMGDPIDNIPYFSEDTFNKRINSFLNLPQFKKYTEDQRRSYFNKSKEAAKQEMIKLQQNHYCENITSTTH